MNKEIKSLRKSDKFLQQRTNYNEQYSNTNLFKNDNYYKMNMSLCFDSSTEEENCQRNIFNRYIELIKAILVMCILFHLYGLIRTTGLSLFILRSLDCILLSMGYIYLMKMDKIENNCVSVRLILEFDLLAQIILAEEFTHSSATVKLIVGMLYNFIFVLPLNEATYYYLIEYYFILNRLYSQKTYFSFILCFFTKHSLLLIPQVLLAIFANFYFSKSQREFWALYDSFKRSYFNIRSIYDEFPLPVFIVSRKGLGQIYYLNNQAQEYYKKSKKIATVGFNVKKKVDFNFKDIFDKKIPEKFIENEIEKCATLDFIKCVDLPYNIGDKNINFKEIENSSGVYEGDLQNVNWMRLYVYPSNWKGNDCLIIKVIENQEMKYNHFKDDYLSLITHEIKTVIDNIDVICERMSNVSDSEKLGAKENIFKNSPLPIKSFIPNSPLLNSKSLLSSPSDKSCDTLLTSGARFKRSLADSNPISNLSIYTGQNVSVAKTNDTDYPLIFLLKYSFNYTYDMALTLSVYNTLRMNIVDRYQTSLHFKNFVTYLIQYFYPISKSKLFDIEFNADRDDEVFVIYDYYRVIFFNIIMFILNNSNDVSTIKNINISIKHQRFIESYSQTSNYKATFKVVDPDPKISHSALNDLLTYLKNWDLKSIDINKFGIIDIGIITSFYIVSTVFESEFTITSSAPGTYTFTAYILASGKRDKETSVSANSASSITQSRCKVISSKVFKPPKSTIEENYYKKIIEKFYKNIKQEKLEVSKPSSILKLPSTNTPKQNNIKKNTSNGFLRPFDKGQNDAYDSDEDISVTLDKDRSVHQQVYIKFLTKTESNMNIKSFGEKLDCIKKRGFRMKMRRSGSLFTGAPFKIDKVIWDDSNIKKVKYPLIPMILVVDDNVIGRSSIFSALKKLNKELKFDIAINGYDAIEKFKSFLKQG
jgi:hypothetical protein